MHNNYYVNHNRRILNEFAGDAQKKWEKETHKRALKKAKELATPLRGVTFKDLSELKVLVI